MSKKSTSLIIATLALAMSASSAFAVNAARDGQRHVKAQHAIPYNARASALSRPAADRSDYPYAAREPFTAAEKRAFQMPTGREVDGW